MTATETTAKPKRSTRRRGNGEGSIFQRADGRWVATVTIGYTAEGKRNRRTVYGDNKRDVQEKLARLQNSKLDGTLSKPDKMTVGQYLDHWLETAKGNLRDNTHTCYEGTIRLHVKPRIGGVLLAKLNPLHVEGLYRDLKSARIRQLSHAVLHRAFKMAVRKGIMLRNPCDAVERPKAPAKRVEPLSADQASKLLAEAESNRLSALFVLALTSGLRQGELFGLKWDAVDLEGGSIAVRHTLTEIKGKMILGEPKTEKGRRRVDLPEMARAALWDHKRRMLAEGHAASDWVFCDTHGGPLRRSNLIRGTFKPMLNRAGLPAIRFHDLRHTAATLLLSEGVHPKIVQERLGHSQIGITLDTYSHVLPTMQREAASKLDGLFTRTRNAADVAVG